MRFAKRLFSIWLALRLRWRSLEKKKSRKLLRRKASRWWAREVSNL